MLGNPGIMVWCLSRVILADDVAVESRSRRGPADWSLGSWGKLWDAPTVGSTSEPWASHPSPSLARPTDVACGAPGPLAHARDPLWTSTFRQERANLVQPCCLTCSVSPASTKHHTTLCTQHSTNLNFHLNHQRLFFTSPPPRTKTTNIPPLAQINNPSSKSRLIERSDRHPPSLPSSSTSPSFSSPAYSSKTIHSPKSSELDGYVRTTKISPLFRPLYPSNDATHLRPRPKQPLPISTA